MSNFAYQAVDAAGQRSQGMLAVGSQNEALQRLREMGLFPLRLTERRERPARESPPDVAQRTSHGRANRLQLSIPVFEGRVKPATLCVFTRQLATLIDAGMPLLRGLRILQLQETNTRLKRVLRAVADSIENGNSLAEALAAHPKIFSGLYVNMVRAGEISGTLEITLRRLTEFMEKAQKIKGKVKAAMFYPAAVMLVAAGILTLMMVFIVPRFQEVFQGLMGGARLPAFTQFVMRLSEICRQHAPMVGLAILAGVIMLVVGFHTTWGRWTWDKLKISAPVVGPVFRKTAISRLTRTLGTLLSSGVPILQALTIVKETAGNLIVGRLVGQVHESVKQGDTVTAPLRDSDVLSPVYVGMVDVGEQTGALPSMLMKIADQCDEDVDNSVTAMTSVLEPIMIVLLAVIVGSIVIAMFLPIITVTSSGDVFGGGSGGDL
jgi:type IV pilus assembly protein PilC